MSEMVVPSQRDARGFVSERWTTYNKKKKQDKSDTRTAEIMLRRRKTGSGHNFKMHSLDNLVTDISVYSVCTDDSR